MERAKALMEQPLRAYLERAKALMEQPLGHAIPKKYRLKSEGQTGMLKSQIRKAI